MPACPLMHGTGLYTQLIILSLGGSSVTLTSRKFDVVEMFDTIERERVNQIAIVGDAFGKPMLRDARREPRPLGPRQPVPRGVVGRHVERAGQAGLLKHHPGMMLVDAFSSSEAVGMGQSVSSGGSASHTATFQLGENTIVVTEDGRRVEPGSGEIGRVAVGGHQPVGYYKDPEKTAATFLEIDGRRYSMPRRLRHGRGRRNAHAARARLGVHQHRRREGLPRGGRGGPQDPPRRARRRGGGRARRQVR